MKKRILILLTSGIFFLWGACEKIIPGSPPEDELLDGPIEGLSFSEQSQFLAGDIAFNDEIFTAQNGLGPLFVATSCGSCHIGDGKGHPFTTLVRFGQTEPNALPDVSIGGPQLQNRAIPGHQPEWLPDSLPHTRFTPPAVTGLGLLAALTDQQILNNADPDDLDKDGISGVPQYVIPPDYFIVQWYHQSKDNRYLGRFGKKAAAIDLLQQTVTAYNQDMGVTSTFEPVDVASGLTIDPEVTDQTVRDVVLYLRTLKAPIQRGPDGDQVMQGRDIFHSIQCNSCHIPQWTTPHSDISALSNKTFFPYTDLLLHDMGPALDDGVTEGSAETFEWRTPPLWGLGLSPDSQGREYFLLHDGRARSIEEAILLHGGEAKMARDLFEALSTIEKSALLTFLESL
ncbi:di-heme oxidoredictase family protein [Flavilitoribacter nigricans]|uniref:Thiol oxidoreductase n=1 Tax=Flavilitoribacter nigricans (strain ATCC 23147 / DSM 23189 / NBRC 102662 / NCIMB 1420 / SS-2) TaxID=1122177 RepID=A0A2D0MZY9_FLAN2|nr:di-heme oxidoredictase family protein [Flavilitoribacter nigricans]PHN01834.1 thiol oxidoreductase [Flavilitoribacter nigricans DSM 23189 = NBRC 102662]